MTDKFDRAQQLEEQHRAAALSAHANRPIEHSTRSHCQDCGDPIPELRRQAVKGCLRCVTCQTLIERKP